MIWPLDQQSVFTPYVYSVAQHSAFLGFPVHYLQLFLFLSLSPGPTCSAYSGSGCFIPPATLVTLVPLPLPLEYYSHIPPKPTTGSSMHHSLHTFPSFTFSYLTPQTVNSRPANRTQIMATTIVPCRLSLTPLSSIESLSCALACLARCFNSLKVWSIC